MTMIPTPTTLTPLQTDAASLANLVDGLLAWPQVLGIPVLALTIWMVWARTQSSADPSSSVAIRTDTGSFGFSISGAYLVAVLAAAVAVLTWPLPLEFPLFGAAHVLLVGVAWWLEKQEAMA